MPIVPLAIVYVAWIAVAGACHAQPRAALDSLAHLHPGLTIVQPRAVTPDGRAWLGSAVDAQSRVTAVLFDGAEVRVIPPPEGHHSLWPQAIAADGRAVAGFSLYPVKGVPYPLEWPFRWSIAGGYEGLGGVPGQARVDAYVTGASDDLRTITGGAVEHTGFEPFVWRERHGWKALDLPEGTTRPAWSGFVSGHGDVVFGLATDSKSGEHVSIQWQGTVVRRIEPPTLPGIWPMPVAVASRDGVWMAGGATTDPSYPIGRSIFVWREGHGLIVGPVPTQGSRNVTVRTISDHGRIVLATNTGLSSDRFTFVWDPIHGSRRLEEILAANGVDLTGWRELFAFDMSADGRVIVGQANTDVFPGRGFRAVIPPLCLADCDGSGVIDVADLLCFLSRFDRAQDPAANPVDFLYADLTNDSTIDFNDFLEFLNLYNRRECP